MGNQFASSNADMQELERLESQLLAAMIVNKQTRIHEPEPSSRIKEHLSSLRVVFVYQTRNQERGKPEFLQDISCS